MPARTSRIAFATLAATLVGCVMAPGKTPRDVLFPASGTRGDLAGGDYATNPDEAARKASVTIVIGGPRQTLTIPQSSDSAKDTLSIGIVAKSASGKNLIKPGGVYCSNGCTDDSLASPVGMAVFAYSAGVSNVGKIDILLDSIPSQTVTFEAYAFHTAHSQIPHNATQAIAKTGTATTQSLTAGATAANISLTLTPLVSSAPPGDFTFFPIMGGPGQSVTLTGTSFGTDMGTVSFGVTAGASSSTMFFSDTSITTTLPNIVTTDPTASITVINAAGSKKAVASFELLKAVDLTGVSNQALAGQASKSLDLTAVATNMANVALATASVNWQYKFEQAGAGGATPTPVPSGGGATTDPCQPQQWPTPGPSQTPTPGGPGGVRPSQCPESGTQTPAPQGAQDIVFEFKDPAGNTVKATNTGNSSPDKVKVWFSKAGTVSIVVLSGQLSATKSFLVSP
ncbi:MAG: hypothetical protein FJZ01_27130 [Candidatus Sericytochromatia bacterium]|nr:hypothetical protein [Candidatus Tanganyikabacteria bacterium]